jgi:hypothetical protein
MHGQLLKFRLQEPMLKGFCRVMCFFDIILEGDALQVVNSINANGQNWSKIGYIIDEIKEGLGKLRSWSIKHMKRGANYATNFLT